MIIKNNISKEDAKATIPDLVIQRNNLLLRRNRIKQNTYSRNILTAERIRKSDIGKKPIRDVKEKELSKFIDEISSYSNSYINKLYAALNQAYRLAVKNKIIEKSIMPDPLNASQEDELSKPSSKKETKVVHSFSEKEQKVFLKALENYKYNKNANDYSLQLLISLFTGMRIGEVNALSIPDINFEDKEIHIHSTISGGRGNEPIYSPSTKTNESRTIIMDDRVEQILHIAINNYKGNPHQLIFYNEKLNCPIRTSQVTDSF